MVRALALVCPITPAIHTRAADRNAFKIRIAFTRRLALTTSARIRALERAELMHSVKFTIISHLAVAFLATPEIHSRLVIYH